MLNNSSFVVVTVLPLPIKLRATSHLYIYIYICPIMFFSFIYLVPFHFDFLQIRDFHIAEREEDIGYYAGYVGG